MFGPQLGTPFGFLLIICCLWFWTHRKGKVYILQLEMEIKSQNRAASCAFFICCLCELMVPLFSPVNWLMSLLAFSNFMIFAISSCRSQEDFWYLRRNIYLAGSLLIFIFLLIPYILGSLAYVPLVSSIFIAHLAQQRFVGTFRKTLHELSALQEKVLRHDADLSNSLSHNFLLTNHHESAADPIETTA